MTTYASLLRLENRRMGGVSTISTICRLDVGIMFDEKGSASYFINEVERTQTMSLWSRTPGVPLKVLCNTFAVALYKWLDDISQ